MNHANKVSSKYISAWLLAAVFIILTVQSRDNYLNKNSFHNLLTTLNDTTRPAKKKARISKINPEKKEDAITPTTIFTMYEKGFDFKFIKDSTANGKSLQVIDIMPQDKKKIISRYDLQLTRMKSW